MNPDRDLQTDLAVLDAMLEQMPTYLESDDLFRQLVVQRPDRTLRPTMTLGSMIERIDALERADLPDEQAARVVALGQTYDTLRARYERAYADKLRRELKSHLDSWQWYLDDVSEGDFLDRYPSEVWLRTRIARLLDDARAHDIDVDEAQERVAALDTQLREALEPAPYAGPEGRAKDYPRERYWWLYGRP